MPDQTYTREQVEKAVNDAANLLQADRIGETEMATDLINIVANAALSLLDQPNMSLDDVLNANWGESFGRPEDRADDYTDAAAWVRSWWSDWS